MVKGFIKNQKFHPITQSKGVRSKRVPKERRQIGIVTGGLLLGARAVAGGVAKGVASGAGKSVTAIGTPLAKSAGSALLSSIASGTKGGLKIAGQAVAKDVKEGLKAQLGQCHPVSINPRTGQVGGINLVGGGVKIDSCVLGAVAQSKTTNLDTISSGLFSSDFNALPEDKKAVALFMQQGNAKR